MVYDIVHYIKWTSAIPIVSSHYLKTPIQSKQGKHPSVNTESIPFERHPPPPPPEFQRGPPVVPETTGVQHALFLSNIKSYNIRRMLLITENKQTNYDINFFLKLSLSIPYWISKLLR